MSVTDAHLHSTCIDRLFLVAARPPAHVIYSLWSRSQGGHCGGGKITERRRLSKHERQLPSEKFVQWSLF